MERVAALFLRFPRILIVIAAAIACFPLAANSQSLYIVTMRGPKGEVPGGSLYSVDISTRALKLIAPLRVGGREPIGLKGIAVHPKTRVFYGITAGIHSAIPRSLVTIDPESADVTVVGPLGMGGSDINFSADGTLYIWLNELNRLGIVNVGTGAATPLSGSSGIEETVGGGFALTPDGGALVSAASASGVLERINLRSGATTPGPVLRGAPFVSAITAMDYAPDGRLIAVNSNLGNPARAELVAINEATGQVTDLLPLPNDSTAIAFGPDSAFITLSVRLRKWQLGLVALAAFVILAFAFKGAISRRQRD